MDLVLYFLAFAITIIAQIFVSSTTNKYFKKKSKRGMQACFTGAHHAIIKRSK